MIRFELNECRAEIYDSCGAENGWSIEYNSDKQVFMVWLNREHKFMGHEPYLCSTLEEVFNTIEKCT